MKILVLGNGFDLDHNLPTSYIDFLKFCNCALYLEEYNISNLSKAQHKYFEIIKSNTNVRKTFCSFLSNNRLLTYFNNVTIHNGENWIDFEKEIKIIINEFKTLWLNLHSSNQCQYNTSPNHKIHKILNNLGFENINDGSWYEEKFDAIHRDLCYSLNNFSKALEFYISFFVNNTDVIGISPDIVEFRADKVLSFNYSNTYERIYNINNYKNNISHVHGFASYAQGEESKIVLGITTNKALVQSSYVEFEKYFQRITKRTDIQYQKWLHPNSNTNDKIEVMFFGHSLDSSDSDIIKEFIYNKNTVINIYYYDDKAYQLIVANLVEIIGKEKLLEFISTNKPKIKFIKQQYHKPNSNAGIEIARDIKNLYTMYFLKENDAETLQKKIQAKIKTNDSNYFYSQRKAVDMFEALTRCEINTNLGDFVNVCSSLSFETSASGKLIEYHEKEFSTHNYLGEETMCTKPTSKLIFKVNKLNEERFKAQESKQENYILFDKNTSEEIKNILIKLLSEDSSDKRFWKKIQKVIEKNASNEAFINAINLLKSQSTTPYIKSKINHFIDLYDEYINYIYRYC